MLYHKKPSLKNVHEWGSQVWVHTLDGTKLDGRWKIGRWIGFEEISNGHQIYWPDKHSVTIECSIKFVNDKAVFLSNPIVKPIQGENDPANNKNLQNDPENKPLEDKNNLESTIDFITNNSNNNVNEPSAIDFVTDK